MKRRRTIPDLFTGLRIVLSLCLAASGCTRQPQVDEAAVARLTVSQKIKTLDPSQADDTYSMSQVGLAYEGLLHYHYLKRPYQLAPALAESVPEADVDGTVYTFKLRKGTLFQDDPSFSRTEGKGREVTAADVVYSIKRLADPKLNSPGWWMFDGKIKGLNEWRGKAARSKAPNYDLDVEGLEVLDRYTVRIRLEARFPLFLHYFATTYASVVPREAVEHYGDDFFRNPVGTGPFRLLRDKSSLASVLIWMRNPTYREASFPEAGSKETAGEGRGADAGKPLPFLERIEISVIGESDRAFSVFSSGGLDLLPLAGETLDRVFPGGRELAPEFREKGFSLMKVQAQDLVGICLNLKDPVLGGNKALRQALSLAFDAEGFNTQFYGGLAAPAAGPIPPGLEGHLDSGANPLRRFSVADAKKALRKAGYPGGMGLPEFSLATLNSGTYGQMAEFVQRAFLEIGVKTRIDAFETWPEFLSAVRSGKSHFWVFAWSADYPDPENFLQLFYGKLAGSGPNDSGYSNPAFDALYEQVREEQEGRKRKAAIQKMVSMLKEDVPWIWGVHRQKLALAQPWLRNVKLHEYDHSAARYYRIDGPGKMRARVSGKP